MAWTAQSWIEPGLPAATTSRWNGLPCGPAPPPDASAPDIFTPLAEQLGLRLVPQTAPIEVLVIDQAEMPGDN
jgi:uncharacterized protein (TIGR03435 family)